MPSVNKVIMIGNLTRDPMTKTVGSTTVTEFGIAANRRYKTSGGEERDEPCFVDVTAWGKAGEVIQKYCRKGKMLYIDGRLHYETWEDKNGGGKRSKLSVVLEEFQFLGGREDSPAGDAEPYTPPPARPQPPPKKSVGANGTPDEFDESSIPF